MTATIASHERMSDEPVGQSSASAVYTVREISLGDAADVDRPVPSVGRPIPES